MTTLFNMRTDPTKTPVAASSSRLVNRWRTLVTGVGLTALLGVVHAAVAPDMGGAQTYAVLGFSTVTSTGPSAISGDLGVSPGNSVTGFPPGTVSAGAIHLSDASANTAKAALVPITTALAGQACNTNLTGQDLGGMTLASGVYCFDSSAALTGNLTLDGGNDPNAVFIIRVNTTLITASNAHVFVTRSAQACNVFWQIGSSVTIGAGASFLGSALAVASVTLNTGASAVGRFLASNGAVTLDSNAITVPACAATVLPTVTVTKVSNGGVGAFGFTGTNGFASQSITTVTAGTGVAGATQTLTAAGLSTTLTEAQPPAGFALTGVSCTGLGAGGVATPNLNARSVTLDTAATAAGSTIACTFTNTLTQAGGSVSAIPTLSEWALILLAALVAMFGVSRGKLYRPTNRRL